MANSYLSRTPGTATNNNKFTLSVWAKRSKLTGDYQAIFDSRISGGGSAGLGLFWGNDESVWYNSGTSSSAIQNTSTSAKFRDMNAWYHIVVAGDTTQSGTDKLKIWVNGVQQTSFGNDGRSSFVGLSYDLGNATYANEIGRKHDGTYYYNGYLSHIAFVDGTALTPTSFGETDSTSGIWKFKSPSGITWGTNGVHLKFENSGAMGTDSSGNSNTYTVGGNLKQALDTPSNVHCTMNPLDKSYSGTAALSNGNTTVTGDGTWQNMRLGTIGVNSGKWYWEMKINSGNNANMHFGIVPETWNMNYSSNYFGQTGYYAFTINGSKYANASSSSGSGTFTNGDIVGIALDLNSGTKTLSVYQNTLVSGSVLNLDSTFDGQFWRPMFMGNNSSASSIGNFNFGNGFFGTTAITSAGSNGNGSLFEYDVPSGFYALNTKNINTYG